MCAKKDNSSQASSEQVLLQTQNYLHNIIDNAPTGVLTLDTEGVIQQVNPAYCQITGYSKAELEGMNYKKLTLEDDLSIDAFNVEQLLEGRVNAYRLEKRYVRKDTKIIWVQVTRSLLRDNATKKPLYFIGQVEDITARKEAEIALRSSEAYLHNIIEHAPVGIVTVSIEGQLLQVNPAYCTITGYSKEELEKMNYKKITYSEDLTIDHAKVQDLLSGKIKSYRLQKRYVRKNSEIIWVQVTRSVVLDNETENALYFIAQVEDITETKLAEKKLHESEERFRNIMENAPIGIATLSVDGQFIQVNQALCDTTGYSEKELKKLTYQDITYLEDLPANISIIQQLLEGKIPSYKMEKRYVRKDGKIIWVQVTRSLLRDKITGVSLYFIAQVEDISERKLMEEKIRRSAEEIADLYENAPCAYHSLDTNDVFIRINATALQWLGYTRDEVINKMKFTDLMTPESLLIFQENEKQFYDQGFLNDLEIELRRKDGSIITTLLNATGNKFSGGRYAMSRSTMFNITDRKRIEKALQESEERFRNIMDNAPIGMALQSLEGQFLHVNHALCEITGYEKEKLEQLDSQKITFLEDYAADFATMQQLIVGKENSHRSEKRYLRKDGTIIWVEVTRSILHNLIGTPLYFIVQIEDIADRIYKQEKVQKLAYHDTLTTLPNRQYLFEKLDETLALAKRHKHIFAILFLDLDKFKQVNDTLGHDIGDELLKQVTLRLKEIARRSDFIARIGGDEFIVILPEIAIQQDAAVAAEKILRAINKLFIIRNQSLQIGVSIGIAIYPEDGVTTAELMKNADTAMYVAKEANGNRYHFY